MLDDLCGQILAHLHANSALDVGQLAEIAGRPRTEVEAALERLLAEGHLERRGDRLVPDAQSHPTPGLFVATERHDAEPLEVDYHE